MNIMNQMITTIKVLYNKIKNWAGRNERFLLFALILIVGITITSSLFKRTEPITPPPNIVSYEELNRWKDKYNKEHATLTQIRLDNEQFKYQLDSLSKLIKVPKGASGVTSIVTKTDTQFVDKLVYVDSLEGFTFKKKDNYLSLSGLVKRDSSVSINLGLVDTLTIIPFRKTSFFKDVYAVDVSNKNPYNHIVAGYSYVKSERVKRFGIGPSVQYDPFNNNISVGIGLQYNIIRF